MTTFKNYIKENPDRVSTTVWWGNQDSRTFGYINNKFFISKEATNHPDYFISLLNNKQISRADFPNGVPDTAHRDNFKYPGRLWVNEKIISFWVFPSKSDFDKLIADLKKNGIDVDGEWKVDVKKKADFGKEEVLPISDYTNKFKKIKIDSVDHVLSPMLKKKKEPTRSGESKMKLPSGMTFAKFRSMLTTSESIEENASSVAPVSTATGQFSPHPGEAIKREGSENIKKKIQSKLKWKDKIHGGEGDKLKPSDVDQNELKIGISHEMKEHGFKKQVATEIALDHLAEDPKYYSKMKEK